MVDFGASSAVVEAGREMEARFKALNDGTWDVVETRKTEKRLETRSADALFLSVVSKGNDMMPFTRPPEGEWREPWSKSYEGVRGGASWRRDEPRRAGW